MPLTPQQFERHLEHCVMSYDEVQRFVGDLALVRLAFIVGRLDALQASGGVPRVLESEASVDWSDPFLLRESGVEPSWIAGLHDPGSIYLHIDTADGGDWSRVARYREAAFLSDKQERVLLPLLRLANRPRESRGRAVTREDIAQHVRRLNALLHWAAAASADWEAFRLYQAHVNIHGASQNVAASVGADGAALAIWDAIQELAPDKVAGTYGRQLPAAIRAPVAIARYRAERPRGEAAALRAILLDNGRAIVFPSDPDIAIFQSLDAPYQTAQQAWKAFTAIRTAPDRASRVHLFAVGEVKTATDPNSLHERSALSRRDMAEHTNRFLMMAILPREFLFDPGGGRRRASGFANRGVRDLAHLFNLYFAWGYDQARENHSEHWHEFKRQMAEWCGLT